MKMEKNYIDREKVKLAVQKSVSRSAILFSLTALFIGIILAFEGAFLGAAELIKIWIAFFVMGIILFFRILADSSRWAMGKPFIVKNLIFMPLFLLVALILVMDISRQEGQVLPDFTKLPLYAGIFLVCFTVAQIIGYFILKAKTDRMNDALLELRKEQKWDEEE